MGYSLVSSLLNTCVSSDWVRPDYLFLHVSTSRISEIKQCNSYWNEVGESNEEKKI